jgi:hypothetical protein
MLSLKVAVKVLVRTRQNHDNSISSVAASPSNHLKTPCSLSQSSPNISISLPNSIIRMCAVKHVLVNLPLQIPRPSKRTVAQNLLSRRSTNGELLTLLPATIACPSLLRNAHNSKCEILSEQKVFSLLSRTKTLTTHSTWTHPHTFAPIFCPRS